MKIDYDTVIAQMEAMKKEICEEASYTENFQVFCHLDSAIRYLAAAKDQIEVAKDRSL